MYNKRIISKSFYDLLKIGFGGNYYKIFVDPLILLYIAIDSFIGYWSVSLSNNIFANGHNSITNLNLNLFDVLTIIFLPQISLIIEVLFHKIFLKKKIYVVNNILDYIKSVFAQAPHVFHEKFSIEDKYKCFTSSIWGFDTTVEHIISICSSFIKIIIISISIALTNYDMALLIIFSNLVLMYLSPKINTYIETFNKIDSHKEYYSNAYYNTVFLEENRINPILNKIQVIDLNNSLSKIVSRYSFINNKYMIGNLARNLMKNLPLSVILILAFYQEKYSYVMVILLNKSVIFGFSDFYENLKKTENSNKKNMEELTLMFDFLEDYYNSNNIFIPNDNKSIANSQLKNLILTNLNYGFFSNGLLIKKIIASKISFDFTNGKNIILISGKTGCGKSLFTKILTGQTDKIQYQLYNGDTEISNGFNSISAERILINQKICEEYTYTDIDTSFISLYPDAISIDEIKDFLKHFLLSNKINSNTPKLSDKFPTKLSGGERQRVALSSMLWKILKTKPSYIIIDEPEKGIDEETMIHIMDWLVTAYKGIIFLITHNTAIKQKYRCKMQSIIKYKFLDDDEVTTEIYQEFP